LPVDQGFRRRGKSPAGKSTKRNLKGEKNDEALRRVVGGGGKRDTLLSPKQGEVIVLGLGTVLPR